MIDLMRVEHALEDLPQRLPRFWPKSQFWILVTPQRSIAQTWEVCGTLAFGPTSYVNELWGSKWEPPISSASDEVGM